jgi:sulfide:quinone oxidoreductase
VRRALLGSTAEGLLQTAHCPVLVAPCDAVRSEPGTTGVNAPDGRGPSTTMHENPPDHRPLRVVVAGGGVAGLEALVALRALAGGRVAPTLVDPGETFHVRALGLGEPFGLGRPRRHPLAQIAAGLGAAFVRDSVHGVQSESHVALLRSAGELEYDVFMLAVGATPSPALGFGILLEPRYDPAIERLRARLEREPGRSVAVVVPVGVGWTLAAYEVALMLAGIPRTGVTLVTAEREPLEAFGPPVSRLVREQLATDGVELLTDASAEATAPTRLAIVGGRTLEVDEIVHLPRLEGPRIAGVPCDAAGFVRADDRGRVAGHADLFAAGDGTVGPIKQGGLAAQQAEAVAVAIARRAGASLDDPPRVPVLRAVLRTQHGPRYLRAEPPGGGGRVEVSEHALWWPPTKVSSSWLMPWLATRGAPQPMDPDPPDRGGWWPDAAAGHRSEPMFRRVIGAADAAGNERTVTFERGAGHTGWQLVEPDGAEGEALTFAGALALLDAADRDAARGAHAGALHTACAAIVALHADARTEEDPARLERLARFADQAHTLADELAAVRRQEGATVDPPTPVDAVGDRFAGPSSA